MEPTYALERLRRKLVAAILSQLGDPDVPEDALCFTVPPDPKLGDLALPMFPLSAAAGRPPAVIAQAIAANPPVLEGVASIAAAGPYVNLKLVPGAFGAAVVDEILAAKGTYGRHTTMKDHRIGVEYAQPNTNKPLHLGHGRNNILGMALGNVLAANGADVVRMNIINDRGIHITKSLLAYAKWGEGATPESMGMKPDHLVGHFYVLFDKKLQEEFAAYLQREKPKRPITSREYVKFSTLGVESRELLRKWEAGDPEVLALAETMNAWAIEGLEKTFERIGSVFDVVDRESEIYRNGKSLAEEAVKKGAFRRNDEGSIVADTSKGELVVLRPDGTSLYATQDLALAALRAKRDTLDHIYFVVGTEQNQYFAQLFEALEKAGIARTEQLTHYAYELVNLPTGKMKSREGTVVDLDDLLDELHGMAEDEILTRSPDLPKDEVTKRAEAIALAALKFYLLRVSPTRVVVFDPKESLSFDGHTGPFIQYARVRANQILAQTEIPPAGAPPAELSAPAMALVRELLWFPEVVHQAGRTLDPTQVANALWNIAHAFNGFYHTDQVLKEEDADLRAFRVRLVAATRDALDAGMKLLGIPALAAM